MQYRILIHFFTQYFCHPFLCMPSFCFIANAFTIITLTGTTLIITQVRLADSDEKLIKELHLQIKRLNTVLLSSKDANSQHRLDMEDQVCYRLAFYKLRLFFEVCESMRVCVCRSFHFSARVLNLFVAHELHNHLIILSPYFYFYRRYFP